ncbi:MaoC family dehydratase N-terminal domain-containing protein [Mycobacterium sp.]|uniref:MaoC family dehydratase N-terminal domain-containing protein n=1 Tax=Mycobacterium sp. TaxID=1785 RepID=UPI003D6A9727
MTLARSAVATEPTEGSLLVTRSRLRAFATATGQTDPTYTDVRAANRAGHRDLPVPPTFYFGVDLEAPDPLAFLTDLGVDLSTVLHAEQEFVYTDMAYAGDELTSSTRITDVFDKKDGALEFVVRETLVTNRHGAVIAQMRSMTVVQNKAAGKDAS